jgi:transposase InsO family protein
MAKAMDFIKEIMYRFGVSNNIIMDNGTQFIVWEFKDFFVDSGIKINYASVSHSQGNNQVERLNGMILHDL